MSLVSTTEVVRRPELSRIVLIDNRGLERECFERSIEAIQPDTEVEAFPNIDEWIATNDRSDPPSAILYSTASRRIAEKTVSEDITALEKAAHPVPVIVLSPFEEMSEMIAALDCGARGYIPACLGIEAMLAAVRLAAVGAVFVPAASVQALRDKVEARSSWDVETQFTARQAAVADRLRRGKPNKLIAYELNMCESTVKVHIRNIMKKLHVTNRTEAGFKLNSLMADTNSAALSGKG